MKDIWNNILIDIRQGENIDAYVAVFISIIVSLLSFFDVVPASIFGGVLLGAISWLSVNVLLVRKDSQNLFSEIANIQLKNVPRSAEEFFSENYVHNSSQFLDAFSKSHSVWIVGMGQKRMFLTYQAEMLRLLKRGGKLRIILVDPHLQMLTEWP